MSTFGVPIIGYMQCSIMISWAGLYSRVIKSYLNCLLVILLPNTITNSNITSNNINVSNALKYSPQIAKISENCSGIK